MISHLSDEEFAIKNCIESEKNLGKLDKNWSIEELSWFNMLISEKSTSTNDSANGCSDNEYTSDSCDTSDNEQSPSLKHMKVEKGIDLGITIRESSDFKLNNQLRSQQNNVTQRKYKINSNSNSWVNEGLYLREDIQPWSRGREGVLNRLMPMRDIQDKNNGVKREKPKRRAGRKHRKYNTKNTGIIYLILNIV